MNLILITLLSPLNDWKVKNNAYLENTPPQILLKFFNELGFSGHDLYVISGKLRDIYKICSLKT